MVGLPIKGNAKNIIPWLHRAQLTMTSQPIIATWETLWLGLAWRILRATGKLFCFGSILRYHQYVEPRILNQLISHACYIMSSY